MNVTGHFDYLQDGRAYGWAFAPEHPEKRLNIEILANGEVIAHGTAADFREDLLTAGIGDGHHLFALTLSHELFDGQIYTLTAREAETGTPLPGGPYSFGPELRTPEYPQIRRRTGLQLFAELFTRPPYEQYADKVENFLTAYRIAARFQETGQILEARSAWLTINQALGENAPGYCKLGECLMLEGNPAEALDAFRIAAGCDMRLHWAFLGMANALYALGQLEEAEEALQASIALQPEDASLRERLQHIQRHGLPRRIESLIEAGQRDAAIALLKATLLRQPDHDQALQLLGDLLCPPADSDLPGLDKLRELTKAQRILDALLDDIEARHSEGASR